MSARSQSHFNGPGPLLSVRDVETHRLLNDIASSGRDCLAIDLAAAPAARHGIPWRRGLHAPLLEQARCRPIGEGRVGDGDGDGDGEGTATTPRAQTGRKRRRRAARRATGRASSDARPCAAAWSYSYRGTAGTGGSCGRDAGGPRPEPCIGACLCARAAETESPSNAAVP